jgi:hypothetical protein
MRLWIMAAGVAVVAGQAFARLGENQIQHEQRYGRAREDAGTNTSATLQLNCTKTYDYEGWSLKVTFERGRAECVEYGRLFPNEDAVMAILRAESGDDRWTKASHERWTNTNGRIAVRDVTRVSVMTAGFAARKAAEEAERRKPKPPPAF